MLRPLLVAALLAAAAPAALAVPDVRAVPALPASPAAMVAPAPGDGEVRIATEGAYPPFNYVDGNEPAGFEVDLARALCVAMKATCTVLLQDWDGMIAGLKERRYDAIMSSMEITTERRHRIGFTKAYYNIPSALIGKLGDAPAKPGTVPDLSGRSVGVVADSEFESYLEGVAKDVAVRPFGKIEDAELDLLTGRLDYVLGDKLALSNFIASREGAVCCRLVADVPVERGEGVGIGVRRDDDVLRERFNAAIDTVKADGTYDRIRAKYFAVDIR